MKIVLIALALVTSSSAFAANVPKVYYVGNSFVEAKVALDAALAKKKVLQCQEVVAEMNKAGTAMGMKAKKAN